MVVQSEVGRAGRSFFVPAVQVMPLEPLPSGGESDLWGWTVNDDLISAEVTLVADGSSEYKIELNNAFTKLPADRVDEDALIGEPWPNGRPRLPRFKYNDFQQLDFGKRLRIDMRYWPDHTGDPEGPDRDRLIEAHDWVPMIAGPIVDMRFTFSSSGGARLEIRGEDDLSRLKDGHQADLNLGRVGEQEAVRRVLSEANFPLTLVLGDRWPLFSGDRGRGLPTTFSKDQTYMQFLTEVARKLDLEIWLEFTDLGRPTSEIQLHIEPSRSRLAPDAGGPPYKLQQRVNLMDFTPTIKVLEQYTKVTVRGRHHVPGTPRRVDGSVPNQGEEQQFLADELPNPAGGSPLTSGPEVRRAIYGANEHTENNTTRIDDERAEAYAGAILRKKAREFFAIHASTMGIPRLRPGKYVEIAGLRPPFDGFYYVDKTVHRYNSEGYRIELDGRRPGMPRPPYTET